MDCLSCFGREAVSTFDLFSKAPTFHSFYCGFEIRQNHNNKNLKNLSKGSCSWVHLRIWDFRYFRCLAFFLFFLFSVKKVRCLNIWQREHSRTTSAICCVDEFSFWAMIVITEEKVGSMTARKVGCTQWPNVATAFQLDVFHSTSLLRFLFVLLLVVASFLNLRFLVASLFLFPRFPQSLMVLRVLVWSSSTSLSFSGSRISNASSFRFVARIRRTFSLYDFTNRVVARSTSS